MVLKALILVGGYGTRLRPLTFSKPKPLVEFANKAIVAHQLEALAKAGVKVVILAVSHKSSEMETAMVALGARLGVEVLTSVETSPMGTAGPIALARDLLDATDSDPFFMLNADVIADYDFGRLLHFYRTVHKASGAEGVIYVKEVADPSRFGVVAADRSTGRVDRFVEKPSTLEFGRDINAGLYILSKAVIKRIDTKPTSIERQVFPAIAADGKLYRLRLKSYWMDVGKPVDFLGGQELYLSALSEEKSDELSVTDEKRVIGPVLIDPSAVVHADAVIGPNVVLGAGVHICAHARVKNATIFAGSVVKEGAFIDGSIVGWKSTIGRWARLTKLCILGEDVNVADEVAMVGTTVCPHKGVKESILKSGTIIL